MLLKIQLLKKTLEEGSNKSEREVKVKSREKGKGKEKDKGKKRQEKRQGKNREIHTKKQEVGAFLGIDYIMSIN